MLSFIANLGGFDVMDAPPF